MAVKDGSERNSPERRESYDVVVIGCGMAGLAAGNRAARLGLDVAILEKSPEERRGGHTRFTESFRVPSADTDLTEYGYEFDIPDYTVSEFYDDIMAQTNGRADEDLARTLVENAGETIEWLTELGVEWNMTPLNSGYTVGRTWFDGEELVETLVEAATDAGADVYYDAEARDLRQSSDRRITALDAVTDEGFVRFECDAAILAAGGYESSPEKRTRYYGPDYDAMTVRGSRYNTGEAIDMVLDAGAKAVGQWGGAHMALIDAAAPDVEGGTNRIDGYQYGLLVNHDGDRFVDEGEDARAHTYAKFGQKIFEQPNREAFILVDDQTIDEVDATGPSDPVVGDDLRDVLERVGCENPDAAVATVEEYNAACDPDSFDPQVLDGNEATGVTPRKSNWALPLDDPPFYAYAVTGGITFAFGGVATTADAEVLDTRDRVIPGLYAAGNSVGDLFYDNYPGGTGLTNAAVFGRIAGEKVAEYVD
ncbi:FAD-dependent tricarballylate dehydrogenase TcuA [Halorussus sp. MSC15.2]|uniref:FAD-dependent tricarballylate dehydrogenase TcuA n=1 Tax=Halorussus sp. MSC15.2 TaxID=2283638 RepID=UPI0013D7535A|nr:FAD-dependent tricarballylate dehydrogenase TcuA [Halorussus sp. MSC15.2]NEU58671.1 FAD-dependent oxidoreductase [Halorussus sp. MSC15.2]